MAKTECDCAECQRACTHTPGWFRPGEAEKAAKLMRMPLPKFFRQYLGVNWWVGDGDGGDVFVLAPALVGEDAGTEYPGDPRGTCVFFQGGKCAIHAAKPFDCAHGNPHDETTEQKKAAMMAERERTVALWRKHQPQIRELLGREPVSELMSIFDVLIGGMFS